MGIEFNSDEAFVLAEQVERKAADFYRNAASSNFSTQLQDLFHKLAIMEDDHSQVFAALRDSPHFRDILSPANFAGNVWPLLANSMIDELDQAMAMLFKNCDTPEDVLHAAMNFERDTIVFFLTLREMLEGP